MCTNSPVLMCVLHEADPEAASAHALTVVLGLAVCESCLTTILGNVSEGASYSAEDYLADAFTGNWVSS